VSDDNVDWMNIVQQYNNSHVLLYAPEPKLQSFAIGKSLPILSPSRYGQ
jgi:N-acetylneuraminate lyase